MATSTTERPAPVAAAARRVRPSDVVLAIWVGFAIVTIVSGVTGVIFEFHDDSAVSREVFGGIPSPLQLAFYVVTPLLIVAAGFLFARAGPQLGAGRARRPRHDREERRSGASRDFRAGVYMQTLLRDPAAGLMHSLIYFGFLVLLGVTTVLEIDHQLPESAEVPARQRRTRRYAVRRRRRRASCSSSASCWAIVRRYVQRPVPHPHQDQARARASSSARSSCIGVTGFVDRGVPHRARRAARRSRSGRSSATRSSTLVDGWSLEHARRRGTRCMWIVHVAGVRRVPRRSCRSRCCGTCSRRR